MASLTAGRPDLLVVLGLWALVLFEPQWFLASRGSAVILKVPTVFYIALVTAIVLTVPTSRFLSRRWSWYLPFLCFVATGIATLPVAVNNGYAREQIQVYLQYWMFIVATSCLVDTAARSEVLLRMYGLQFLWWAFWGGSDGLVPWHHSFNNYDAYGAFMVGGVGMSFFLGTGAPTGWFRRLMFASAALCAVGIVASFARGAFLGAIALFGVMWIRSPRKGATLMAALAGTALIVMAASLLHPSGFFWAEMRSTFMEGASEGTGEDRWVLWKAAWRVFLEHPLIGVGPRNFGPFAAAYFDVGEVGGLYGDNPGRLYNRSLHSIYFTILSELGLTGTIAFLWILWDFWRRNAALRSSQAQQRWIASGGILRLHSIALGLEAGMIGFLTTGAVYPMMNMHWFFTTLALNLTLHKVVTTETEQVPAAARGPRRAAASSPPSR